MKKGDIISVNDYSWATEVTNGELEDVKVKDCAKRKYTVIETNCNFSLHNGQPKLYRNDTVIQAIDGGEVIFIHGVFLRPMLPTHEIIIDIIPFRHLGVGGTLVEIPDNLYQEILRQR